MLTLKSVAVEMHGTREVGVDLEERRTSSEDFMGSIFPERNGKKHRNPSAS